MLVSTLLFILIAFMLIVLFSMIPVLWRIRTDYGIGGQEEQNYRRSARDFQEPLATAPKNPARPGLSDDASPATPIQPKADPAL